ncbi:MAG: MucR family transcriptional regulator [Magnetospirillum sp.]|nr:MucR family transcriptional regulator [Magnetospirillum sp.]
MLKHASKIVTAYMRANPVPVTEIPSLISLVVGALERASAPVETERDLTPAVPIKRSVTAAAVICLECGAQQKTLRRHLQSAHGLTPDDYRARWNLPNDYPMVAPDYAERRSQLAKDAGLGRKRDGGDEAPESTPARKPGFRYPASRWSKTSG